MSRHRFLDIMKYFHLNNNELSVENKKLAKF